MSYNIACFGTTLALPMPGKSVRLQGKVVGRRRVERALRSVSVNSGGDLPLLMQTARRETGRFALRSAAPQSLSLRSDTTIPSSSAYRYSVGEKITPAKVTFPP